MYIYIYVCVWCMKTALYKYYTYIYIYMYILLAVYFIYKNFTHRTRRLGSRHHHLMSYHRRLLHSLLRGKTLTLGFRVS